MEVIDIVFTTKPDADQVQTEIAIQRIESLVKDYCNRDDIPTTLNFLIADMVIDYLSLQDRKTNPDAYVSTKSVKDGDTTVELSTNAMNSNEASLDSILSDYKSQLNKYRKLRW